MEDRKSELLKRIAKVREMTSKSAAKLEELEERVLSVREMVTRMKEEVRRAWPGGSDTT